MYSDFGNIPGFLTNQKKMQTVDTLLTFVAFFLLFIFPIFALFLAAVFYKHKISYPLFVYFAFYFGWQFEPQMDLLAHYEQFMMIHSENSLLKQWLDPSTLWIGKEPFPVLFKYLLSRVTTSPHIFSASACAIYAGLFCFMLSTLRDSYVKKINLLTIVAFLGVVFVVEFYWFLGLRFWSGFFVFVAFYIKYLQTKKRKFLYFSFLCLFFHFAHLAFVALALINEWLQNRFNFRYIFVVVSFFFREFNISIPSIVSRLSFLNGFVNVEKFASEGREDSMKAVAEFYRSEGNQFYMIRTDLLFWTAAIVLFFLYRKDKSILSKYAKLWGLILLVLGLANIGYGDLIFYDRMFKAVTLLLYIMLFMYLYSVQHSFSVKKNAWMFWVLGVAVSYGVLTPLVEERSILFNWAFWFDFW